MLPVISIESKKKLSVKAHITLSIIGLIFFGCDSKSNEPQDQPVDKVVVENQDSDKEIVCFVYHRFGDSRYPSTNISMEAFKAHLDYLKENDFQVLSLSGGMKYLRSNEANQKTAVITIDDGYQSFYENGLPLLEKYGFEATLFINTETVGGSSYMDWEAIKDCKNRGIEIGNHTHSHAFFLDMPESGRYENLKNEIERSQKLISENIGVTPVAFAYPYGELDDQMKKVVQGAEFKWAAAQNSGVIYSGSDPFRLPRFPMAEGFGDPKSFSSKVNMSALRMAQESPSSFILPKGNSSPELTIRFDKSNLILDQLQCFIQGGECQKSISTEGEIVTLEVSSKTSISSRRRTLYTITVPDQEGNWHWFSHLWINPEIR